MSPATAVAFDPRSTMAPASNSPPRTALVEGIAGQRHGDRNAPRAPRDRCREAAEASVFYTSVFAREALDYGKRCCSDVAIISAKYGLVELGEILQPYPEALQDLSPAEMRAWAAKVATWLAEIYPHGPRVFEVLSMKARVVEHLRYAIFAECEHWETAAPLQRFSAKGHRAAVQWLRRQEVAP